MQFYVSKHFILKNDFRDFRLYISLCLLQCVLTVFYLVLKVHIIVLYAYTQYRIEMQDNYIAVHFQRSFHDMGGGLKSAVEFSSSSSYVPLRSQISSTMSIWIITSVEIYRTSFLQRHIYDINN